MYSNGTEEFAWGSELQGRGRMSLFDTLVGLSIWILSFASVSIGILNLYIIKKLTIFHNAFGALWVSRTVGEIGANAVHFLYSGPLTVFQIKNIAPHFGIAAYTISYLFAAQACAMNQYVSINRLLAVYTPLNYNFIFSKRTTAILIIVTWIEISALMALYFVIPCSLIGYSPQFYEFIFVKSPECVRDYSLLGTITIRGCTVVCSASLIIDIITFYKIIHIKATNKKAAKEEAFRRNVRFFAQTAMQNLSMMFALTVVVLLNNEAQIGKSALFITAFDGRILTYLSNGLSIILFNPEVRKLLRIPIGVVSSRVLTTSAAMEAGINNRG
uniref:G_PROTEIN_RECEP_F1_2 domain-containing protein n=1 Tax=Steinernema glaseri TaxID=37863 RepID=A0A1I7YKI4_9BILA